MTKDLIERLRAQARALRNSIADLSDPDTALVAPGFAEIANNSDEAATLLECQAVLLGECKEALSGAEQHIVALYDAISKGSGENFAEKCPEVIRARTALKSLEAEGE